MSGAAKGFLITAGIWVLLLLAFMGIEALRGHVPFAMFTWNPGGKYVTSTILLVLGLGTALGYTSDRIRSRMSR